MAFGQATCQTEINRLSLSYKRVDLATAIRYRLEETGLGQRELATAAEVTESYISQLLSGKKLPPASERSEIYKKIAKFLRVPERHLTSLADAERQDNLKLKVLHPPRPLFQQFRSLILRKCVDAVRAKVAVVFNREPFGEFERLITQALLDVTKKAVRDELENPGWINQFAKRTKQTYEEVQVSILDFLDTDVFHVTLDNWVSLLGPLIDKWEIDLETFQIVVTLNSSLIRSHTRKLRYSEVEEPAHYETESGLNEFLKDPLLSKGITNEEIAFLKTLQFHDRRPSALYYYRELQNLRDPLNFTMDPVRARKAHKNSARTNKPTLRGSHRRKSIKASQ
jgi:transcriptional regulator with XRE-family HTH domain